MGDDWHGHTIVSVLGKRIQKYVMKYFTPRLVLCITNLTSH